MRRWRGAALVALAVGSACAGERQERHAALGQWIWTEADARLLSDARRDRATIVAGVWLGTITWRRGALHTELGRSPSGLPGEVQVVVRLDDSFHAVWDDGSDSLVAARLTERLAPLLALGDRGAPVPRAVQVDYDAPVRLLPRYAAVLGLLRAGVLAGRAVWVTSIPAHVRAPSYGTLFRPVVDGHILQLFDTGDRYTPAIGRDVTRWVRTARVPFHVGLGAFERRFANGAETTHEAWRAVVPALSTLPEYRGTWIFPAGRRYLHLIPDS